MKFTCSRDDLVNNLSIVQRAVTTNSTVNILNGILIEASDDDKIKLTGYDLQTGIEADVEASVTEKGAVVIDSKFFGDIIRKLPEPEVDIVSDSNFQTTIKCGQAEFKIAGLDPEPFPKIPEIDETGAEKIVMGQKILKSMINHTIFAVSRDNSRPVLTGSNVVSDGSVLSVVSIDGFRMAINREDMGNDFNIYTSMQNLLFDIGNVRMVSRLIEGQFINFDSIITKNPKTVITINRKQFLDAVDRASLIIMTDDRKCPVRFLSNNPSELTVQATSARGNLQENIDISLEGDLDVLKNIEDEEIRVEVNGGQGPCIIKPVEGEKYIYLILPIRR